MQDVETLKQKIRKLGRRAPTSRNEDRFQIIFNSMDEVYFETDLAGNLVYFNPALVAVSGYPPEELIGKNNREYTSPETARRMYDIFSHVYRTGKPANITDYKIYPKSGNPRFFEISTYLIRDENGEPIGFGGIGRDITERKQAEKELRESEERFRRLQEASFGAILIHEQGRILDCNKTMCTLSGYDMDELIGKDAMSLISPEHHKLVEKRIAEKSEGPYDIVAVKKDGTRLPVEIQAKVLPYGGKTVRVTEIRDISARKKAEEAIRKSRIRYRQLYKEAQRAEELYQSLLNSSADAIVIMKPDLTVQYVNPAFSRIFGWTAEEVKNKQIPYVPKPAKESFQALMEKIVSEGEPVHGIETQRFTKDERLLDVSMSASHYIDHSGNTEGVLLILRDITETKRYQWHMYQAQKMESLGTLAGGVAHDFNNLLMGIQGRLSLLMMRFDKSLPYFNYLQDIEEYVVRAADLTQQLLGIARSGKYEVRTTNINKLIEQHNQLFGRTRKEISIHEDLDANLYTAAVDRRQIEQVLLNIYVNASHAMPHGGDLYVHTRNETLDDTETEPHDSKPGRYLKISITDTGIGMSESVQKRIFEPFFTTKQRDRGTGLGLASAYGIIKNHGGFITVYSEQGRGTTFNIYLPASSKSVDEQDTATETIINGKGHILLVDDEEMIVSVGEELLGSLGYEVTTATSGREAVDIYRQNMNSIDLIILDLIMPGQSGSETFDQLRRINPDCRILLASGYSLNGEASAVMSRGCNGFIQKPFNLKEISNRIGTILGISPSAGAANR